MKYYVVITNGLTAKTVETYLDETKALERVSELNIRYAELGYDLFAHLTAENEVSKDEFLDRVIKGSDR